MSLVSGERVQTEIRWKPTSRDSASGQALEAVTTVWWMLEVIHDVQFARPAFTPGASPPRGALVVARPRRRTSPPPCRAVVANVHVPPSMRRSATCSNPSRCGTRRRAFQHLRATGRCPSPARRGVERQRQPRAHADPRMRSPGRDCIRWMTRRRPGWSSAPK